MTKRTLTYFFLIAFFVGAAGSILLGRFFIPYLAAATGWESLNKLVTSSPIIINRTSELQLNEGVNLIDLAKQANNITVSIYSPAPNPSYLGNGVVMTSDGLIFTSKTIFNNQKEYQVVLNDGRVYQAQVRAVDPKSDIGVLTINEKNLNPASFANALDLQVGQRLITIGETNTPFNRSATAGYVSNTAWNTMNQLWRPFTTEVLENSFETDSEINNGRFVGSPIINLNGKVVGMATGFAMQKIVISENLQTALNSYLSQGKIIRPKLGLSYFNVSQSIARLKNLPRAGVEVIKADDGSPAAGKLLPRDLIFEVDGQSLDNQSFEQIVNRHAVGEIKFKLLRNGKEAEVSVNLE
ncbi:MAG: S1C family serine protease, partial [Candidatus Doudnabacteria bacterium]|nr:S1C family serine protease [Candidatus Doudnabacteria bacterium]